MNSSFQSFWRKTPASENNVDYHSSVETETASSYETASSFQESIVDSAIMNLKRKRSVEAETINTKAKKKNQRKANDSKNGQGSPSIKDLPAATRLIIRGMPSDRIPEELLAERFGQYGEVLEIVPKDNYTFIQFPDVESCANAVKSEQGQMLEGWQFVLQVCRNKPNGRDSRKQNGRDSHNASREKDMRSRISHRQHGEEYSSSKDTARSVKVTQRRHADPVNSRIADYKAGYGGRSRSPSSTSSDRRSTACGPAESDDEPGKAAVHFENQHNPISRRFGEEVPTVQTIATSDADHSFVRHIENVFRTSGILIHTLFIQPDLATRESLIKKMIVEGVRAVLLVERDSDVLGTIQLQVFDRSTETEAPNVRYDEYEGVTVENAVLIVQRTLQSPIGGSFPSHPIAAVNPRIPPHMTYYGQSVPQGPSIPSLPPHGYSAIPVPTAQQMPLSPYQRPPSGYLPFAPQPSAAAAAVPASNAGTSGNIIDVSALENIQNSIQLLINKQAAAQQQTASLMDINAIIETIQRQLANLASAIESQQKQQPQQQPQPQQQQQHTPISKPSQIMQQLTTTLNALSSGGSKSATALPTTGYPPQHIPSVPQKNQIAFPASEHD
ncbi:hypothetical protein BX666DRAFT_1322282 [Dichotomocladium elegans]|nr:hypothetical protein BX666DRAFT_1322282 [Dichotomocladium elegans]